MSISRRHLLLSAAAAPLYAVGPARVAADAAAAAKDPVRTGPNVALGRRSVFPPDDAWNADVSGLKTDPASDAIIAAIGIDKRLHPDFGTTWQGAPSGIPYVVVTGDQPKVPIRFEYKDESDPGPYPVPPDAPIEGGPNAKGDRHVLIVDRDNWMLYELFSAYPEDGGKRWRAGSGAIFDLKKPSVGQRPKGWTSADAAGLPVFPGLVRYDEIVERKELTHALRFTVQKTRKAYVSPATHYASSRRDNNLPPMGLRVRLREGFDITGFPPLAQVILRGLKKHGMILADNGGDWFVSGSPDPRWDDEAIGTLKRVRGKDFEVLAMGKMTTG